MIKEIKHPYKELSELERERIDLFRSYHLVGYDNVHVYYVTDLSLCTGYDIIVSLHTFTNASSIKFDDVTKNITDIEHKLKTFNISMKDNKTFKDLDIGDIIYYYDHCVIKKKIVTSKPQIIHHKEACSWLSSGYHEWNTINFTTTPGKPIELLPIWNGNFDFEARYINSSMHFSNKEAAKKFLNKMREKREYRVRKAKIILEKETRILNKYKFEDGEE